MSVRLVTGLAAILVVSASAALAQPMSDAQGDRAHARQEVGQMQVEGAQLHDLDVQIKMLEHRIHHESGDRQREDVAHEHELQAQANQIRAGLRHQGADEHATMRDMQQDRATPH